MNLELLNEKLSASAIKERVQGNTKLSYIEGHHAIREANRIFGHDGWSRETTDLNMVQCEQKENKYKELQWYVSYTAKCEIELRFDKMFVTRQGTGFGQGIDKDLGRAHESAMKEAETDAMKRALMTFGDPFGLALYDKAQEHVERETAPAKPIVEAKKIDPAKDAATKYLRSLMTDDEGRQFINDCKASGLDWIHCANLANGSKITTVDGLIDMTFPMREKIA